MRSKLSIYTLSLLVVLLLISVLLFIQFSNTPASKKKENFIQLPKNNQIFQQINNTAYVNPVLLEEEAQCLVDNRKLSTFKDLIVKVGKHTIKCETEESYDSINFFVGDVFIIAGQSNAVGASVDIENIPQPNSNTIWYDPYKRAYRNPGIDKDNHRKGLEIGGNAWVSFANKYHEKTKIPVGLINLTYINPIDNYLFSREFPGKDFFYTLMLNEIEKNKTVKGIIWYHGESAVTSDIMSKTYENKLTQFISFVRKDLNNKELPFYLINIARHEPEDYNSEMEKYWMQVRTGINNVAAKNNKVFIAASAHNLPLNCEVIPKSRDCIHLSQKGQNMLGEKIANFILELNKN